MSRWAASCLLVTQRAEKDETGVYKTTRSTRRVPCNVFSLGDAAYYAAFAAGVRPEAVLRVRRAAYSGESLVEFEGRTYQVARVDRSSPDFVRLTLSERVGDRGEE